MNITVNEKEYELDLGIGFALQLDAKFKFTQQITQDLDAEFGLGVQILYGQLTAASVQAIVDFYKAALHETPNRAFSKRQLEKAIEQEAIELGGFDKLAGKCIEALQNVGLYQYIINNDVPIPE